MNRYANLWREPLLTPVQEATHWVETLAKYGNMEHLIVKDYGLSLFQYFCIEILFILAIAVAMLLWSCFSLYKYYTFQLGDKRKVE